MTVYDDEKIVGIREEGWVKENIDGFVGFTIVHVKPSCCFFGLVKLKFFFSWGNWDCRESSGSK